MNLRDLRSREANIDRELDGLAGKIADGSADDSDMARYRQLAAARTSGMMPSSMRAKMKRYRRLKRQSERLAG